MSNKCGAVAVPLLYREGTLPTQVLPPNETALIGCACLTQASALKYSANIDFLSFTLLLLLQILDILSTVLGLQLGAHEANFFMARMMRLGTLPALLLVKLILVAAILAFGQDRLIRRLNCWFAGLVTWNMAIILFVGLRSLK